MVDPGGLEVRLLGRPAVREDAVWHEPAPGRVSALLYYLAFHGGWVGRGELVYLFWPDVPEDRARGNLRPLLTRAYSMSFARSLERERTRVRWSVRTDLQRFRQALAERRLTVAWASVEGELLSGFSVPRAPEFAAWVEAERAELNALVRAVGLEAAEMLAAAGDESGAIDVLAKLRRRDPLDEDVARLYVAALLRTGAHGEALAAFEELRRVLADEVGAEPAEDTLALLERARAEHARGRSILLEPRPAAGAQRPPVGPGIPVQATRFVGRAAELSALRERIADPDCRLLSLVGPGGVGKSRLAIEAARGATDAFEHGVSFVELSAVSSAQGFAAAVAEGIGLVADAATAVVRRLSEQSMLLVLDNVEHLIDHVTLVREILTRAPGVKVLATSRRRLGLPGEWLVELDGMAYPVDDEDVGGRIAAERYDAVALFVHAARRIRADVELDTAGLRACARICARLGGVPLALELAATWLRLLTVDEIATELDAEPGRLLSPRGDADDARHTSMWAVFEHSWSLLATRERQAMGCLSVFRGGWSREAAWAVAEVGMPSLLALLDASLIRREPSGRFDWHPLVGEFARDVAARDARRRHAVSERHARYYLGLLTEREQAWRRLDGAVRYAELDDDLANVVSAWRWAVEQADEDLLTSAVNGLGWACFTGYRFELFVELAHQALAIAAPGGLLRGRLLVALGSLMTWRNSTEGVAPEILEGLELVEAAGSTLDVAFAYRVLGVAYARRGAFAEAQAAWERGAAYYRSLGNGEGIVQMLCNVAGIAPTAADALQQYRHALDLARHYGEPHSEAMAGTGLGRLVFYLDGPVSEVHEVLERACELHAKTGFREYTGITRKLLTHVHAAAGRLADAQATAEAELLRAQASGSDEAGREASGARAMLGWVSYLNGDHQRAATACMASLRTPCGEPYAATEVLARTVLARVALAAGDLDEASNEVERAEATLERSATQVAPRGWYRHPSQQWEGVLEVVRLRACATDVALARGEPAEAKRAVVTALRLAHASGQSPAAALALAAAAALFAATGDVAAAQALVGVLRRQPGTPFEAHLLIRHVPTAGAGGLEPDGAIPAWLGRALRDAAPSLAVVAGRAAGRL